MTFNDVLRDALEEMEEEREPRAPPQPTPRQQQGNREQRRPEPPRTEPPRTEPPRREPVRDLPQVTNWGVRPFLLEGFGENPPLYQAAAQYHTPRAETRTEPRPEPRTRRTAGTRPQKIVRARYRTPQPNRTLYPTLQTTRTPHTTPQTTRTPHTTPQTTRTPYPAPRPARTIYPGPIAVHTQEVRADEPLHVRRWWRWFKRGVVIASALFLTYRVTNYFLPASDAAAETFAERGSRTGRQELVEKRGIADIAKALYTKYLLRKKDTSKSPHNSSKSSHRQVFVQDKELMQNAHKRLEREAFVFFRDFPRARHLIYVEKDMHVTSLYTLNKIVMSARSISGGRAGQKEYDGDRRTPEGLFTVLEGGRGYRYSRQPYYLHLNAPNWIQLNQGMTGSNLLITGPSYYRDYLRRKKDITVGHVQMEEGAMSALYHYVKGNLKQTYVAIISQRETLEETLKFYHADTKLWHYSDNSLVTVEGLLGLDYRQYKRK